jgi:hypothetical protein
MKPAAANNLIVDSIFRGNFPRRHEFDGGAQGITDSHTEKGPQGAVQQLRVHLS